MTFAFMFQPVTEPTIGPAQPVGELLTKAVDQFERGQTTTALIMVLVAAFLLVLGFVMKVVYDRLGGIETKVDALDAKVGATSTDAIRASADAHSAALAAAATAHAEAIKTQATSSLSIHEAETKRHDAALSDILDRHGKIVLMLKEELTAIRLGQKDKDERWLLYLEKAIERDGEVGAYLQFLIKERIAKGTTNETRTVQGA